MRLADGDRSAFDVVYDAVAADVQALCRRRLGDPVLADDIAQEALTKLFVNADAFDPDRGSGRGWALGVAGWECRTAMQRQARAREGPPAECPDPKASPEDRAIAAGLLDDVAAVLGGLSPNDRATLLAAWADGPRPAVTPATFRKRLQRALARFRTAWSHDAT